MHAGDIRPKVTPEQIRALGQASSAAVLGITEAFARLAEAAGHASTAIAAFKAEYEATRNTPSQIEGAQHGRRE